MVTKATTLPEPGPIPPSVEWKLVRRSGADSEERTYTQSELSIEGEARILGMGTKIGALLKEKDFDINRIANMIQSEGDLDWDAIFEAITLVTENAPALVAETALTFVSIFPTSDDGTPNREYDDHQKFMRGAINVSKFTQMVRVFVAQNDWERMARPFWNRATPQRTDPDPTSETSTQES